MNIEKLDPNLRINHSIKKDDIIWLDVREEPFEIFGLYRPKNESVFKRMPADFANKVSTGVSELNTNTSGGRVRFATDSKYIAIRTVMKDIGNMSHMPLSGKAGFDLYTGSDKDCIYSASFMPSDSDQYGYEALYEFDKKEDREITINFPLYNGVDTLYIGLEKDAVIGKNASYKYPVPIVFYGSSITQGGCASRPGNMYPSIISRKLDSDYICLGFSGNAKGEQLMAEYIATLNMSLFVMDYDHNAPNAEHLQKTHYPFYELIRQINPELPIIMVSKPDTDRAPQESKKRRDVIYASYQKALDNHDENVYFIDGSTLFGTDCRDSCTVDGCHPNDLGFYRMACVIGEKIKEILD
ncbi:hypothetical protein SDC9_119504 [bioreactor metagenome]|uniref:SGNH hydrolase-type esterase domain-containing protein n=1 Tax=bioreactor metagenome TaxID=1076179 RepID=A0A645C585_9ZZZZ